MTVAIFILRPEPQTSLSVQVAAQAVYANEWVGVADRLGLVWLQRFESGAPVAPHELPQVIAEFDAIRAAFDASGKPELALRAKSAAQALRGAAGTVPVPEVFIG